jgi:hypothetical protein
MAMDFVPTTEALAGWHSLGSGYGLERQVHQIVRGKRWGL